jgi:hypothetical protein
MKSMPSNQACLKVALTLNERSILEQESLMFFKQCWSGDSGYSVKTPCTATFSLSFSFSWETVQAKRSE